MNRLPWVVLVALSLLSGVACADEEQGLTPGSPQPPTATAGAAARGRSATAAPSATTQVRRATAAPTATVAPSPTQPPAPPPAPTNTPQPPAPPPLPPPPDFSAFAQTWGRHGFGMTVDATGQATASWRVYKWCSDDPTPPCDDMTNSQITDGGHATIVFDRVVGSTAYGQVVETNDPQLLSSQVSLTLQPYDMAQLDSAGASMTLCGPNFWQEAPESLQQESPCGA